MSKRNIVLVSMDSLRGDHCGYLGDSRGLTPTLDSLAAEGVAFQNGVATGPQTFSSMPAVFTGQDRPAESLEGYSGETHWQRRLSAIDSHLGSVPTIAEFLQNEGYTTVGVSPNPWTSTAAGFDRGFDRFVDLSTGGTESRLSERAGQLPGIDTDDRAVELGVNMVTGSSFFTKYQDLYERVQALREEVTEPYFLWVFLLDTHFPFLTTHADRTEQSLPGMYYSNYRSAKAMRGTGDVAPPAWVNRSLQRSYRDTIRASDTFLAQLHSEFASDDPVVVVHSDHGESFGEHGNYGHHHRDLYEENIHVPYVVHNADCVGDINTPASLAGINEVLRSIAHTGTFDPADVTDEYVRAQSECGTKRTVRGPRFKYVETPDSRQLFDLAMDPTEQVSVPEEWSDLFGKLQTECDRFGNTHAELQTIRTATDAVVSEL